MTDRPILRPSFSSPGTSPGPSSSSARPSIVHSNTSFSPPSRGSTPPPGHTKVSFPWEPTREKSMDHSSINAAGLHSAFAHHTHNRPDSSVTITEGDMPADETGTPSSTGYNHTRKSSGAGGLGIPKTRTSSTGHSGMVHADFGYTRKVGFETFEKSTDAALFSYTLQAKSDAYRRTRNTRVFMVAVSPDESGNGALEWLMESLIEDGDEIVAVRVIELDEGEKASKEAQEEFREEAGNLLKHVLELNDDLGDRQISVIVEFVAGRVSDTLMRLISLYRPDSLVVGTKGTRSKLQKFGAALGAPGMGSVSRFSVSHSPVPVIVVRPERKVKKTLEKRQNDPKRQKYAAMVGSEALGLRRSRSAESRDRGATSE